MLKRLSLISLFAVLLLVSGCAAATATAPMAMEAPRAASDSMAPAEQAAGFAGEYDNATTTSSSAADDQRIVIRNASLTIVVDDPGASLAYISRMAEEMGGFVVTSNLYKTTTRDGAEIPEANINVRVPAERLNDALDEIKAQVRDPENDVRAENVTGEDVTKEYTDLRSQLRNYEDAEAQLREIMASATRTEDVLSVFQQLTEVRRQIEVLKGQIQYYEEAAALSSIDIRIQAQAAVQPLQVGGWKPVGVARNALQALIDTLQFLGSATIWIIIFVLPVGLVIFIPIRILWWLIRRATKNRRKPAPPAMPPTTPPAEG